jgi:hypothetical protein
MALMVLSLYTDESRSLRPPAKLFILGTRSQCGRYHSSDFRNEAKKMTGWRGGGGWGGGWRQSSSIKQLSAKSARRIGSAENANNGVAGGG